MIFLYIIYIYILLGWSLYYDLLTQYPVAPDSLIAIKHSERLYPIIAAVKLNLKIRVARMAETQTHLLSNIALFLLFNVDDMHLKHFLTNHGIVYYCKTNSSNIYTIHSNPALT
jgi:hypothetical protein